MSQFSLQNRVTGKWAKDVSPDLAKIGAWTKKENERWVSRLPEVGQPPKEAFEASTEESVAYQNRKNEWDRQYGALLELARLHHCDLVSVQ